MHDRRNRSRSRKSVDAGAVGPRSPAAALATTSGSRSGVRSASGRSGSTPSSANRSASPSASPTTRSCARDRRRVEQALGGLDQCHAAGIGPIVRGGRRSAATEPGLRLGQVDHVGADGDRELQVLGEPVRVDAHGDGSGALPVGRAGTRSSPLARRVGGRVGDAVLEVDDDRMGLAGIALAMRSGRSPGT